MKINFKNWGKWRIALLILVAYNLIVLINIPQIYISNAQSPQPQFWHPFAQVALSHNIWTILTPFVLWLGWIFPVTKPKFFRNLFLHFLSALGAGIFLHFAYNTSAWLFGLISADDPNIRRLIFGFDVYLFLRDGKAGSREKLKTPNFKMYPAEN